MDKLEFLSELRRGLAQMPGEEREAQLTYYEELFDDMLEEGMSEREAAEQLGDPSLIAQDLLAELPLGTLVKTRVRPAGGWTALSIVLITLGSPVWLPLLLAFAAVVLAVVVTLWALAFAAAAVVLAAGVCSLALLGGTIFGYFAASPLMLLGLALIAGGACLLGGLILIPLFRGIAKLCAALWRGIKSLFIRKEV